MLLQCLRNVNKKSDVKIILIFFIFEGGEGAAEKLRQPCDRQYSMRIFNVGAVRPRLPVTSRDLRITN